MESEAAARLWNRSQERGYRYLTFIGNGDTNTYGTITGLNGGRGPYSVPVKKEECLNHVSKRLGMHLRKLKKDLRVPTEAASSGRIRMQSILTLTDKHIDAMASHYGTNIHAVGAKATVEAAQCAILATYHHARSTDAASLLSCRREVLVLGKESRVQERGCCTTQKENSLPCKTGSYSL